MTGSFSEISSWSLAAISYVLVGSSPSPNTTDLRYICDNFTPLTQRWVAALPAAYGDVTAFARSAVCSAADGTVDPRYPLNAPIGGPNGLGPIYLLRSFLAGILTLQAYHGDRGNSTYYGYLCYYLEDSLLEGLYASSPDMGVNGSIVDVESSFCANGGGFGKGPQSEYTQEKVSAEVRKEVGVLVTEMVARGMRVLLGTDAQVTAVCGKLGAYKAGFERLGLDDKTVEKILCAEKKASKLEKATEEFLGSMTKLFTFQFLHGGTEPTYHQYLCENLVVEDLELVRLNGQSIKKDACNAAAA